MMGKLLLGMLLLQILPLVYPATKVSFNNLLGFFNSTFDPDCDGSATSQDFLDYFRKMEPDHNLTMESIMPTFELFDSDNNGRVNLKELVDMAKITITYKPGHKQIHIGFTSKDDEMQVMWVSNPETYAQPVVQYGILPTKLNSVVNATTTTYNAGHFGFHGKIYRAVLTGLVHEKRYYYRVGDLQTGTFSSIKFFKAPPAKNETLEEINIAVFGDMGTFAPFGHMVISQIQRDNFVKPFDFVFHTGDIAYAGMDSKIKEIEPIWDLFGELTESFAAYSPYMPGVGNHEKYTDYIAYKTRYVLPREYDGQTNFWFSFDYGQVHIVHISSEHPYNPGSEQYNFLEKDLKRARQNPNTRWIILGAHRSFYCSDLMEYSEVTPLAKALEDLVNQYQVDIVQTGHLHCYERSWPTYKNKPLKDNQDEHLFINPEAPIYVVQGTAGALIDEKWVNPVPAWSIRREMKYGYGRITITENKLKYQYILALTGKVMDEFTILK